MKDQTGTRIGLPVVLAFVIVFGLILTRHSDRYEVSPSPSTDQASAAEGTDGTIGKASFSEPTAREWERRWPTPDPSDRPSDAGPADPSPSAERPPERGSADSHSPRHDTDEVEREASSSRPAAGRKAPPAPPVVEIPKPSSPTPVPVAPEPRPKLPKLPEDMSDDGIRTAQAEGGSAPGFVRATFPPAPPKPRVYVIKPNDNLSKICKAVYGTANHRVVQALYEANRGRLKSKNRVLVGQRLSLPPWPPTGASQTRLLIPLSQQAVKPSGPAGSIRLPHTSKDRGTSGRETRSGSASGKRKADSELKRRSASRRTRSSKTQRRGSRYRWYRVKRNQSLSTIARDQLGNGRRWHEIWKLNKGRLRRPNHLPAGTRIKVPLAVPAGRAGVLAAEGADSSAGAL